MEQIVYTNLYILHVLSNLFIKLYLIQPLPYPFYPPYVSISSPQPLNLFYKPVVGESYCIFAVSICDPFLLPYYTGLLPKKCTSLSKRGFLIKTSGSPVKREISTSHYRKKYLLLCHTLHHYGSSLDHLRITLCTYCINYNNISLLYFICNDFFNFYYLLSQLLWFFKCYFVLYIYILWFYILLSLRCFGSAFLYMAVFFPLFFRSFDVETSFWCR